MSGTTTTRNNHNDNLQGTEGIKTKTEACLIRQAPCNHMGDSEIDQHKGQQPEIEAFKYVEIEFKETGNIKQLKRPQIEKSYKNHNQQKNL